jgi:hypothetical protein
MRRAGKIVVEEIDPAEAGVPETVKPDEEFRNYSGWLNPPNPGLWPA